MRLSWMTDVHLNFLSKRERLAFYDSILAAKTDAVLITGDIAEAPSIENILLEMVNHLNLPIYFVLGNHDYYHGNIREVREAIQKLVKLEKNLHWLTGDECIFLNKKTILIGQDNWADGRYGDYPQSTVVLNDSVLIDELAQASQGGKSSLLNQMQNLADADAATMKKCLEIALSKMPEAILILTHVPPFEEVCYYAGERSGPDWIPFYSSKAAGDVLLQIAQKYPEISFTVLCGHTHHQALFEPLSNLSVRVGSAEYAQPNVGTIITL